MQKGISTLVGIIIIVVVALILFGGVFAYQYFIGRVSPVIQTQPKYNPNQNQASATEGLITCKPTWPICITSINPSSGPAGTVVTLTGNNFTSGSETFLGISESENHGLSPDSMSPSQIKFTIPTSLPLGPHNVDVFVSAMGNPTSNSVVFTVTNPSAEQEPTTIPTTNGPFSSPIKGETFVLGDTIPIKWDSALIDASTINMVCVDTTTCSTNYEIYGRQDLSDPVSKDGSFSYTATNYIGPGPGKYKIVIYSYGQKSSIESEEFTITPAPGAASPTKSPFYIQNSYGQKSVYSPGEPINISVDARDWNGVPASSNLGFNVQALIFDANNHANGAFQAVNASYDYSSNLWNIQMNAPSDKSIIYDLQIILYCGSGALSSTCAQEHGNQGQIEKSISFTLQ